MDYKELLKSVSQSAGRAWERVRFLSRANRILAVSLFLVLSIGLVAWASTGFSLEIGRFFAAEEPTPDPTPAPTSTTSPSPSPTVTPKAPWLYCDYATKTYRFAPDTLNAVTIERLGTPLQDFEAAGAAENAPCVPGTCRRWEGADADSWRPLSVPATTTACEPLSVINGATFPGYRDPEVVKPPITYPASDATPNCFVIEDRGSDDPNFSTFTDHTVPTVLRDRPNAKLFMKAFVVNNCPWEVHYVLQVDLDPRSKTDNGAGSRMCGDTEASGLVKFNMPDGFDFPSCWNSGGSVTPANCAREISIEFDLKKFTCGSAGITTAIWHRVRNNGAGGGNAAGDKSGTLSFRTHLDWGKDCSGLAGERRPLCGAGGPVGGTCPTPPKPPAVKPAVLSVQCGTTQNVLTWQNPRTLNASVNSVLRTAKPPTGNPLTSFVFGEGGCWNTFGISTYTDRAIQSGFTYEYSIKTDPAIASNKVACRNGVQVTPSPSTTPAPTTSPGVTSTPGPTGTPGPTITPPAPGGQLQCGPLAQTVTTNQQAFVQAFGGTGTYSFSTTDDGGVDIVADNRAALTYPTIGAKPVTVSDGEASVECTVNVSAPGGDDDDEDNDSVPDDVECPSFPCVDTDNDGIPDYQDIDSDNDGIPDSSDCNRLQAGGCGSAGTVPTGPGEATLLALVISALASLLYVSYTHSPLYQRREAEHVSEDQGPMDFRS